MRESDPPWVPKLGPFKRNEIFLLWSCLDKSYVFHRSLNKNKPKFGDVPDY